MRHVWLREIENEDLSRIAEEVAIRTGYLALVWAVLSEDAADEIIEERRFGEKQVALRGHEGTSHANKCSIFTGSSRTRTPVAW